MRTVGRAAGLALLLILLSSMVSSSDGVPLMTAGGVLRWGSADRWQIYGNGHLHRGLTGVSCAGNGRLIVGLDAGSGQVGYGAVTVDEHLTAAGVSVGVSGSSDHLTLFFYRRGQPLSCRSSIFKNRLSNVWVLWMIPE